MFGVLFRVVLPWNRGAALIIPGAVGFVDVRSLFSTVSSSTLSAVCLKIFVKDLWASIWRSGCG